MFLISEWKERITKGCQMPSIAQCSLEKVTNIQKFTFQKCRVILELQLWISLLSQWGLYSPTCTDCDYDQTRSNSGKLVTGGSSAKLNGLMCSSSLLHNQSFLKLVIKHLIKHRILFLNKFRKLNFKIKQTNI